MKKAGVQCTLSNALKPSSPLLRLVLTGLGAVLPADCKLIAIGERGKVGDSIDLDSATRTAQPNAHRWDYILSIPSRGKLIGLEPHSASDGEVKVVIKKKQNAQTYLRTQLHGNYSVAEWYWVTRGSVGFSRMSKSVRALSANGIGFSGRLLKRL